MIRLASLLLRPFFNLDQFLWEREVAEQSSERIQQYHTLDKYVKS